MFHSKQWHYSLHRDLQNCYSTRRSPTGFFKLQLQLQLQFYKEYPYTIHPPCSIYIYTCAHHTTHPSREFSIQNPILHAEDKELFEYYTTRNPTHRRQGDLLEMHLCVLQDLPVTFQAFSHKSLQRQLQLLQLLQRHSSLSRHSRHSSLSSLSRHSSRSRHSRDIPDIPVIHDLPASPGNSSNSTMFQYLQGIHPIPAFSD